MLLLLFSSAYFWILFGAFIVLMIGTAKELTTLSIIATVSAIALLHFVTDFDMVQFAKNHTKQILIWTAVYFPIGILWSFLKWYFKLQDAKSHILEQKNYKLKEFAEDFNRSIQKHKEEKVDSAPYIQSSWESYVKYNRPKVSDYKSSIINWISYWPCSMLWTLLDDFVTRIAKQIYNHISGTFNKISDKVFEGV